MSELTGMQTSILQVLSVQSDGYLCSPFASAFITEGLDDPEKVQEELVAMQDKNFVEYFEVEEHTTFLSYEKDEEGNPAVDEKGSVKPVTDDEGNIKSEVIVSIVDSGWSITEKGQAALKEV